MTPETIFIDDILAGPSDVTSALIYADWLEDQDRWQEALHLRFCAQSRMQPVRSRDGKLAWWDEVMERFPGRLAVGKEWLVKVWSQWQNRPNEMRPQNSSALSGQGDSSSN